LLAQEKFSLQANRKTREGSEPGLCMRADGHGANR
jgi:hypothetical protein